MWRRETEGFLNNDKEVLIFFPYQTAVVVEARMQVAFLSEERDYTDQNVIGSCK